MKDVPTIIFQTDAKRHGRGWALRKLWSHIDADYYAFSDADFSAAPSFLVEAIRQAQRGSDIVVGSRYVPGSTVNRPPVRHAVSRMYNRLVRLIFRDGIFDHQCGLKVFSRKAIERLLPISTEDSWFWDTEMLVLAHEAGLHVTEIPIRWIERKSRRTSIIRLLSDVYLHGAGLIRLVSKCSRVPHGERPSVSLAQLNLH